MSIVYKWMQRIAETRPVTLQFPFKGIPKARPRAGRSGVFYTPKRTQDFEKAVAHTARNIMKEPMTGGLKVEIWFTERAPKTWPVLKKLLAELELVLPTGGDLDNCVKAVTDGLNGVAYVDDDQIHQITAQRRYADHDGITVKLTKISLSPGEIDMALASMKAEKNGNFGGRS